MPSYYKPFGQSSEIENSLKTFDGEEGKQSDSMVGQAWRQLLGGKGSPNRDAAMEQVKSKNSADKGTVMGEILFQLGLETKNNPEVQFGNDYHREYFRSINKPDTSTREQREFSRKIEQILYELKNLIAETRSLKAKFGYVAVEQAPQKPGKYHENFFEWLLKMIQQARKDVENSSAWLGAIQGKGKNKDYWGKAKKHGTTFTQSNERVLSTSTG